MNEYVLTNAEYFSIKIGFPVELGIRLELGTKIMVNGHEYEVIKVIE